MKAPFKRGFFYEDILKRIKKRPEPLFCELIRLSVTKNLFVGSVFSVPFNLPAIRTGISANANRITVFIHTKGAIQGKVL